MLLPHFIANYPHIIPIICCRVVIFTYDGLEFVKSREISAAEDPIVDLQLLGTTVFICTKRYVLTSFIYWKHLSMSNLPCYLKLLSF